MIIFLTLTTAGSDSGPFNLYSDSDGYTIPFDTDVFKYSLEAGYSTTAPDGTQVVKVVSTGVCINSTYITLALPDCILAGYLETVLNATSVTFITNEDTNFTIQLLGEAGNPNPDYIITSLPNTLQGDIYDPGTGLKITTVPYTLVSSGTTVLFDPAEHYFGNVDSFNFQLFQDLYYSNVATVTGLVLAVNDSPIFDQLAPLYDGLPGGTYTYTGTVSDPDNPLLPLVVTFVPTVLMPNLPSGWTLVQTPGTNQFTLTGPVPSGADYSITLQVSDGILVTQQLVTVNSVYSTLASMEFKVNYRAAVAPSGVAQSPETTGNGITISTSAINGGHVCNRAQFNLVAGIYADVNSGQWQWSDLGKANLNNNGVNPVPFNPGVSAYNLFDNRISQAADLAYGTAVDPSWVNVAAGMGLDPGAAGRPVKIYDAGNPLTFYNVYAVNTEPSSADRTTYFKISNAIATSLATESNWGGSSNINRGVVKFKLVSNNYTPAGIHNPHSGNFGWLQVFKSNNNSQALNQEEVLVNGASFIMTGQVGVGNVTITVNILTNQVSVASE